MADLLVIAHGKLQRSPLQKNWAAASGRLRRLFGDRAEICFTSGPGDATLLARQPDI